MSIICTTYIPEGIILIADSRISINMNFVNKADSSKSLTHIFPASDNAQKLYLMSKIQAGIAAGGASVYDNMSAAEFLRKFEKTEISSNDGVYDIASKLCDHTRKFGKAASFHVAGYEGDEPFFFTVADGECKRLNTVNAEIQYGITWSGEVHTVQKMLFDEPKPMFDFKMMSLTDAIEFSKFLINTEITIQRYEMKPQSCGGKLDVLVLTPNGAFWYDHKYLDRTFIPMPTAQKTPLLSN